jgi:hypothetical protein
MVREALVIAWTARAIKQCRQFGRQGLRTERLRAGWRSSKLATSFRSQCEVHLRMNQWKSLKHLRATKARGDLYDGIRLGIRKKQAMENTIDREVMSCDVLQDPQVSFVESGNVGR